MADFDAKSPAIRLLELTWNESLKKTGFSWRRLNRSMDTTLKLAIDSGMEFYERDFAYISEHFRIGYWGSDCECYYTLAASTNNLSAARSFESWRKRKPFIMNGIGCWRWIGCWQNGGAYHSRTRGRLTVNTQFSWQEQWVTVTSFAMDQSYLIATRSMKAEDAEVLDRLAGKPRNWRAKVIKRYRITHEDLRRKMKHEPSNSLS